MNSTQKRYILEIKEEQRFQPPFLNDIPVCAPTDVAFSLHTAHVSVAMWAIITIKDNYTIYKQYKMESSRLTSGAMYSTVPQNEYVFWSYSDSFERPKSKKKTNDSHVLKAPNVFTVSFLLVKYLKDIHFV